MGAFAQTRFLLMCRSAEPPSHKTCHHFEGAGRHNKPYGHIMSTEIYSPTHSSNINLILPVEISNHRVQHVNRAADLLRPFSESIRRPHYAWFGHRVQKFLTLCHARPRIQTMKTRKFESFPPILIISCHGTFQSKSRGGPTRERGNRRNTLSMLHGTWTVFLWAGLSTIKFSTKRSNVQHTVQPMHVMPLFAHHAAAGLNSSFL